MKEILKPQFMDSIFNFIHLYNQEASLIAFDCINEILSQNFVPSEFDQFMVTIFNQLFRLLESITQSTDGLDMFDEEYVDKFTQFTSLFVAKHLRRVESKEGFPIIQFLELLYKFTFIQTSLEGYLSCIEIWETLLDYIISQQEGTQPSLLHQKYSDGLAALGKQLIIKIQYKSNAKELESLDTSTTSDDIDNSELESFIGGSLDLIGKIAQLYPEKILNVLAPLLDRGKQFLQIESQVNSSGFTNDILYTIKDSEILLRIFSQTACGFVCY